MEKLELCVSVDIYVNETAERYADYVLPATDMLERSDFPLSHLPMQAEPYAQYSDQYCAQNLNAGRSGRYLRIYCWQSAHPLFQNSRYYYWPGLILY